MSKLLTSPDINVETVSTFALKAVQLADFGALENDIYGVTESLELKALFSKYVKHQEAQLFEMQAY